MDGFSFDSGSDGIEFMSGDGSTDLFADDEDVVKEDKPSEPDWRAIALEGQKKITETSEALARSNNFLQEVIQNQHRQATPPTTPAPAQGPSWMEQQLANMGGQQPNGAVSQPTPEQIAGLVRQETERAVAGTLTALSVESQKLNELYARFHKEHPDLAAAYTDVVASHFTQRPDLPAEQRYQNAIGIVRNLINRGALPPPNKMPQRGGVNGAPRGGQGMNSRGGSSGQQQGGNGMIPHLTNAHHKAELDAYTKNRREQLEERMISGWAAPRSTK